MFLSPSISSTLGIVLSMIVHLVFAAFFALLFYVYVPHASSPSYAVGICTTIIIGFCLYTLTLGVLFFVYKRMELIIAETAIMFLFLAASIFFLVITQIVPSIGVGILKPVWSSSSFKGVDTFLESFFSCSGYTSASDQSGSTCYDRLKSFLSGNKVLFYVVSIIIIMMSIAAIVFFFLYLFTKESHDVPKRKEESNRNEVTGSRDDRPTFPAPGRVMPVDDFSEYDSTRTPRDEPKRDESEHPEPGRVIPVDDFSDHDSAHTPKEEPKKNENEIPVPKIEGPAMDKPTPPPLKEEGPNKQGGMIFGPSNPVIPVKKVSSSSSEYYYESESSSTTPPPLPPPPPPPVKKDTPVSLYDKKVPPKSDNKPLPQPRPYDTNKLDPPKPVVPTVPKKQPPPKINKRPATPSDESSYYYSDESSEEEPRRPARKKPITPRSKPKQRMGSQRRPSAGPYDDAPEGQPYFYYDARPYYDVPYDMPVGGAMPPMLPNYGQIPQQRALYDDDVYKPRPYVPGVPPMNVQRPMMPYAQSPYPMRQPGVYSPMAQQPVAIPQMMMQPVIQPQVMQPQMMAQPMMPFQMFGQPMYYPQNASPQVPNRPPAGRRRSLPKRRKSKDSRVTTPSTDYYDEEDYDEPKNRSKGRRRTRSEDRKFHTPRDYDADDLVYHPAPREPYAPYYNDNYQYAPEDPPIYRGRRTPGERFERAYGSNKSGSNRRNK